MQKLTQHATNLQQNGFTVLPDIYSADETERIISAIEEADTSKQTFRKSAALFAVRQFLKEIPGAGSFIFNENLNNVITQLFGNDYFVVKSIYFDKPATANWFVAYHRDLTISVDKKTAIPGFGPWTVKQDQFSVQPPLEILQNIFTIRIHLDDTTEENGALKIIRGSHLSEPQRTEQINAEEEIICTVPKGGIMIMRPLLLHSSARTTNNKKRRVIHIEFSNYKLPKEIKWAERK